MQFADFSFTLIPMLERVLNRVNNILFEGKVQCDSESLIYYTFKKFPPELKPHQHAQWAELQKHVMSPFSHDYSYHFLSSKGICFWSCASPLLGVPETAMQSVLSDGVHIVKGAKHVYRQQWSGGQMLTCEYVRQGERVDESSELVLSVNGWARTRDIDPWLSSPLTWGGLALAVTFVIGLALLSGHLFISSKIASLSEQQVVLEVAHGDKLIQQSKLSELQMTKDGLLQWQNESGFLPQSLSYVAEAVMEQTSFNANSVRWQNNSLLLEIVAEQLDIARVVTYLENIKMFNKVSVRPGSRANTWQIEVEVNG